MNLELTAEERGELKRVLSASFKTSKKEFQQILSDNSDFENIAKKVTWDQAINDVVDEIVNKTKENGLIEELLNIVLKNRSKNSELQKFFNCDNCSLNKFYLNYYSASILKKLATLQKFLKEEIKNNEDINKIFIDSFSEYMGKVLNEIDQKIATKKYTYISKRSSSHNIIPIVLLRLIVNEQINFNFQEERLIPDNDNKSSTVLQDFVEFFSQKILNHKDLDKEKNIKEKLKKWIKENCPEVTIRENLNFEKTKDEKIINYLFIVVKTQVNDKVELLAEFAQFKNNKQKIENEQIVNLNKNLKSVECFKKEIAENIFQFAEKVNLFINLSDPPIIDLFVPIEFLNEDFDNQQIKDEFGLIQRIGKEYPFVLRSFERCILRKGNSIIYLNKNWGLLQKLIPKTNGNQELFYQKIKEIENEKNIKNGVRESIFGIKILFPLSENTRELFGKILKTGTPLCLWTRYRNRDHTNSQIVIKAFKNILNVNCFKDFSQLYQTIQTIRSTEDENNDLAYNLAILFDHDKLPSKKLTNLISQNQNF